MKKREQGLPSAYSAIEERIGDFIRHGTADDSEFARLAMDLYRFQRAQNEPYEKYCRTCEPPEKWQHIPAVPQSAFKHAALRSFPEDEVTTVFRTSGTTGEGFGRHYFRSTRIYEESILRGWDWFGLPRMPQLVFTLSPEDAPESSLSYMMGVLRARSGGSQCFCVGRDGTLDVEPLRAVCHPERSGAQRNAVESRVFETAAGERRGKSRRASGIPPFSETHQDPSNPLRSARDDGSVCIMGTALAFLSLFERGEKFILPAGSCAVETGGYKGSGRTVEKAELYAMFEDRLGLAAGDVINEYSMTEISSQFYTRGLGNVHRGPPWTRVLLIDPETGREVETGQIGMIRIFDLANVGSVLAIQTQDLAIQRDDGFELLGRDPAALPRGCSRAADELLAKA